MQVVRAVVSDHRRGPTEMTARCPDTARGRSRTRSPRNAAPAAAHRTRPYRV